MRMLLQHNPNQPQSSTPRTRRRLSRGHAFTLMEVIIALGVFAIGFAAIAAVFPVAVLMQKEASDSVQLRQTLNSTESLILGMELDETSLTTGTSALQNDALADGSTAEWDEEGRVMRLYYDAGAPADSWVVKSPSGSPTVQQMPLALRSLPSMQNVTDIDNPRRSFYWVPLIQDGDNDPAVYAWRLHIFIMKAPENASYDYTSGEIANEGDDGTDPDKVPAVKRIAVKVNSADWFGFDTGTANFNDQNGNDLYEYVNIGDRVLDIFGNTYEVIDVDDDSFQIAGAIIGDPDYVWLVPPHEEGKESPLQEIVLLNNPDLVQP